jgi:DNA-binding MltR family transcriptional regulator
MPGEKMTTQDDLKKGWQNVVTEFHNKSDRAAAIIGAAFLDAHLGKLIASFFVEDCGDAVSLLDADRPLGNFSARVRAAYCMGLISKNEYHDMDLIMQIQHVFANRIKDVAFTDNGVREKCFMLRIPRDVLLPGETRTPRQLFVFATAILTQHMAWRAVQAANKRCQVPEDFMLVDAADRV